MTSNTMRDDIQELYRIAARTSASSLATPIQVLDFKAANAPMSALKAISIPLLASQAAPVGVLVFKVPYAMISTPNAASIPTLAS